MKWLIFEDALCDFQGHWFEHITTIRKGLLELGDEVEIFCAEDAISEVREPLHAKPILPESIWQRMGDGAGPWERFVRIPRHALATWRVVSRIFADRGMNSSIPNGTEVIFVPTVLPHHLLGWCPLVRKLTRGGNRVVLFYFLSAPVVRKPNGSVEFERTPSAILLRFLLRGLRCAIDEGRVVLGAETCNLAAAITEASGPQVAYLPQPVQNMSNSRPDGAMNQRVPVFATLGAARWEKGSDILQDSISDYLADRDRLPAQFVVQWVSDFRDTSGQIVEKSPVLVASDQVTYIDLLIQGDEYAKLLRSADAIVLPYRRSAYDLRGSRVLLEAIAAGIPCITTRGTAPAQDLMERGCGLFVENESSSSLKGAIKRLRRNIEQFESYALSKKTAASAYYSVANFRSIFSDWLARTKQLRTSNRAAGCWQSLFACIPDMLGSSGILLRGWYGEENLGDDLLLAKMMSVLPRGERITVAGRISGLGNMAASNISIKAVPSGGLFARVWRVLTHRYLVLGGGGLYPSNRESLASYADLLVAAIAGKKIIIIGIGINPNKHGIEKLIWRFVGKKSCAFTVRDSRTHSFLLSAGCGEGKIDMCHDLLLAGLPPKAEESDVCSPLRRPYGLIVPAWFPALNDISDEVTRRRCRDLALQFSSAADELRESGMKVVVASFFPREDEDLLKQIEDCCQSDVSFMRYGCEFGISQIDKLFGQSEFVVCMRFHALVCSILAKRNFVSVNYDYKSSCLLEELGLDAAGIDFGVSENHCFGKVSDLPDGALATLVRKRLGFREQVEKHLEHEMVLISKVAETNFDKLKTALAE